MSDTAHELALERFELVIEAETAQRTRETNALKFQVPELQWSESARDQRQGGTIGNVPLPKRPMMSIPTLDQPIQLILNAEKAAHLGVNIHPLSEEADQDTADMLQDLYRRIEVDSRAHLARSWAFERAVKAGRGFYRVLTEYDPAAPEGTNDQRIVIKRLLRQEAAYLDPFSQEPDWSDADFGFITDWMPWSRYKQINAHKKRGDTELELANFSDDELVGALGMEAPAWMKGDGASRAVLIAEYFTVEIDAKGRRSIRWRKINGVEVIDEKSWAGKYIPIIPVIGRELVPFDTERRFVGIIEPNMDAQRFINYSATSVAETVGSESKAQWVLAEGQEEGHEQEFLLANVRNFPYVRYKPTSLLGQPLPPPQRVQADTSKLSLGLQALAMGKDFLHAGTGAFEPTLGQNSPNVRTKGQTLALQGQHEEGNSNWIDNLAEMSMSYEARVVLDLMCGDPATGRVGVYDRVGRIARTLDGEGNHDRVMLNQPFVRHDGKLLRVGPQQPLPQGTSPDEVEHYNLRSGAQYSVTVNIGKAYKSRVEQGADMLGQLIQSEPELVKLAGDIYFRFADFPGHMELAERFKKMLPPQLQDQNGQGDPKVELEQAKGMLQQLQQQSQAMQKALETDQVKVQGQYKTAIDKAKIDALQGIALQKMKDATSIAVAQINASVKIGMQATEARNEAIALGQDQTHEADQNAMDRQHDVNQVVLDHQQKLEAAQQQHQHDLEQTAQGGAIDATLSDQGHQQGLDAAQQQAELQPPPAEGASA